MARVQCKECKRWVHPDLVPKLTSVQHCGAYFHILQH